MSFRLRHALTIAVCALSFASIACGSDPPDKEIQQAEAAIAAAHGAQADEYAVEEFTAAQAALSHAREAVADRDYRLALNHALDSRERAQNAAAQATLALATARTRADTSLAAAVAALNSANVRIQAAEAVHAPARMVTMVRTAVTAADANVQKARAAREAKDFTAAIAAADAASEQLAALSEDLDGLPPSSKRRR